MLARIIEEKWLTARGVCAFWPAHREGDDILLDDGTRLPMLRQQFIKSRGRANFCLSDFIDTATTGWAVSPWASMGSSRIWNVSRRTMTITATFS
jgi:5-methyltetrahydrofolate--homocysteine methyltransferase